MDQTLTCPVCGYDNEWDGSRARTIPCKRCETELRTPGKNSVVRVADRPEAAPPEAKPRSAIWKIVVFSLVGLKIAAIAGKIIFDLNKGPQKQPQAVPQVVPFVQVKSKGVPRVFDPDAPKAVPAGAFSYQLATLNRVAAEVPGNAAFLARVRRALAPPMKERIVLVTKVGEEHFTVAIQPNFMMQPLVQYNVELPAAFLPEGKHEVKCWIETVPDDPRQPARKLSNEVRTVLE